MDIVKTSVYTYFSLAGAAFLGGLGAGLLNDSSAKDQMTEYLLRFTAPTIATTGATLQTFIHNYILKEAISYQKDLISQRKAVSHDFEEKDLGELSKEEREDFSSAEKDLEERLRTSPPAPVITALAGSLYLGISEFGYRTGRLLQGEWL